ncbi:MAG: TIGR02391 family protein [Alphaproteobacteria bacterium]|nr:TIGR02391 family protein [Alphaproteobacteria bacterium]
MWQLPKTIKDPDVLLALEPEELAATMLFLIKRAYRDEKFHPGTMQRELWDKPSPARPKYDRAHEPQITLAVAEAWAWLEAQGLIVPAPGSNGQNGWRVLSRRARQFESEAEFESYAVARRLPKELLHPKISGPVWMSFMRGEFDTAVFQAMKAVEVEVRDAARFSASDMGVALVRKAFNPETGPLTDKDAEMAERQALANLFAGAIGSYKNPHSHRNVPLDDPAEAAEIVMLANHLLRIIDARRSSKVAARDDSLQAQ